MASAPQWVLSGKPHVPDLSKRWLVFVEVPPGYSIPTCLHVSNHLDLRMIGVRLETIGFKWPGYTPPKKGAHLF